MGSVSEEELEAMEGKARKLTMLDLKKRALAAKQEGDIETAMQCLKKAKKLEVEDSMAENEIHDEPPYSSTLPLFWKKVALLCKQAGDIDRAKQALLHSKELEAAEFEPAQMDVEPTAGQSTQPLDAAVDSQPIPPEKVLEDHSPPETNEKNDEPPPLYDTVSDLPPPPPPAYENLPPAYESLPPANDNLLQNCQVEGATEEEAAMLAELMGTGGGSGQLRKVRAIASNAETRAPSPPIVETESADQTAAAAVPTISNKNTSDTVNESDDIFDTGPVAMSFTDEELMDEEMMLEFANGGAQGIPTQEEYAAKVLAYKKLALKFKKELNIPKATQNLRIAKQLEKVALALKKEEERLMDPDDTNWLETLDPEESDLLGELMGTSQNGGDAADSFEPGSSSVDKLTIEDLEEMDDDKDVLELVDMMGPDALPTVEEVSAKIEEEKQKALKFKQEGNIEMAKTSLVKSKKIKAVAMRLASIHRMLEAKKNQTGDDDDGSGSDVDMPVSMEALEALMKNEDAKPNTTRPIPQKVEPPKDPWLLKPSSEIKAEVIRLKNEKMVKEATRLLQLYKQKLAEEQKEAERQKITKMISTIQKRLDVCKTQRQLWQYYQWFGKETVIGGNQHQEWTNYEKECKKAIQVLESEGSTSVTLAPRDCEAPDGGRAPSKQKLYLLKDDLTSLVESCTNETTFATLNTADDTIKNSPNFLKENTLEVAILGLFGMEKNEKLKKIQAKKTKSEKAVAAECPDVRIQAKLQLPIDPEDPSKPYMVDLEPSDLSISRNSVISTRTHGVVDEFNYGFDCSSTSSRKQVLLPRKDPKHERLVLRRIESKTIQLSIFYLHNQNKRKEAKAAKASAATAKKSWFFGRGEGKKLDVDASNESEAKDIFLGKVRCNSSIR